MQTGLTALDLAKTQDIHELLLKPCAKEEKPDAQQQGAENQKSQLQMKVESHQKETETGSRIINKEFTHVCR